MSTSVGKQEKKRDFVYPKWVTVEMLECAKNEDPWHFAGNLNAMLEHGYCRTCKLVPVGCLREGCGPEERAD